MEHYKLEPIIFELLVVCAICAVYLTELINLYRKIELVMLSQKT